MHRIVRCLFSVPTSVVIAACFMTLSGAHAQAPQPAPTAAPPAASHTVAVAGAKKAIVHRRHRRRIHRRHSMAAAEPQAPKPAPYPGRLGVKIRLIDGKRIWGPTRHQLGVVYAPGGTDKSTPGTFQFTVKPDVLKAYLKVLAEVVHRSPVDAHPTVADPKADDPGDKPVPAKIVDGKPGEWLDVNAAVDEITKAIEADPTTVKIDLPVHTREAKVSADKFEGIDSRIGYFVTRFNPGDTGRTQTVRLAINMIDGKLLQPGETFSVNGTVGERTIARGFGVGHVFVDGKMKKDVGGGMCQVATTLFNAAMLADLKIIERHQHVRTIPYATPGRDATVWYGQKDFKFKNDTDAPVYVSYKTTYSRAVVAIYGKAVPGRKVKLVNHYRQLGERHFTGSFYRVTYEPDGKVVKGTVYYSDYQWTPALDYQR